MTQAQELSCRYDGTRETIALVERLARELAVGRRYSELGMEYFFSDGSLLDWQGFPRKFCTDPECTNAKPCFERDPITARKFVGKSVL